MLFGTQWPGDAIAAPVWVTNDREDETPLFVDDGSWSPTDIRSDQSREAPDRCDLVKSPHRYRWISLLTSISRQAAVETPQKAGDPPYQCCLGDGG